MGFSGFVRNLKDIGRIDHILAVLVKNELGFVVDAIKIRNISPHHKGKGEPHEKVAQPKVIRETFEELGGAFIKLGQFLSLRPDLIPKEYCDELKKLQDRVRPFDGAIAEEIVKKELSKLGRKLKHFDKKPIASGSIAQVHRAVLPTGKHVVIKVQKEDIRSLFRVDIDILKHAAKLIERRYGKELFSATEIVDEFERYTLNELDFLKEAKNIDKFHANFIGYSKLKIPRAYWEYTTDKILTLEDVKGENIETLKSKNIPYERRKKIVKILTEILFKQIFEHGFFHADPHPGNIFVTKEDMIIMLDFGIVGEIDPEIKEKLSELFICLIEGDSLGVTNSFISLNIADKTNIDKAMLKKDLKNLLGKYHDTPLSKLDIGALFHNAVATAKKNKLHLPSDLVLLGKSLVTVEGFCVELDPEYNLVETCTPFMKQLKDKELSPKSIVKKTTQSLLKLKNFIKNLPDTTEDIVDGINKADKSMDKIGEDIKELGSSIDHSVNQISFVILAIGFLLASVFMINFGKEFVLGIPLVSFIGFCTSFFFILILFYNLVRGR